MYRAVICTRLDEHDGPRIHPAKLFKLLTQLFQVRLGICSRETGKVCDSARCSLATNAWYEEQRKDRATGDREKSSTHRLGHDEMKVSDEIPDCVAGSG